MEKILFIAPSRQMAEIAARVCSKLGLNIAIEIGANQEVPALLNAYPHVDVIISRGGTAEEVKKLSKKTVVAVAAATSDLLSPVHRLAIAGVTQIGVVAKWNVIDDIVEDIPIGDIKLFMRPWRKNDEVRPIVEELIRQGVTGVVGDRKGAETAKECGLAAEFLDSGEMSVRNAINEAVEIMKAQEQERLKDNERAQQIRRHAAEIHTVLEQVAAATEELTASSQQLAATSQYSADIARQAAQEVNNTTAILEMVRRVAQQTNLLGLNAAIEAARAGQAGRGFSVVADEVRKLAEESNRSARSIGNMLQGFRSSMDQVLQNVNQSNAIIQEQAKATQEIARMLDMLRLTGGQLMEMAEIKP